MTALCLCMFAATNGVAATRAGTRITNTATLRFDVDGVARTSASNTITLTTAELLDVVIVAERATIAPSGPVVPVSFLVTNTGNGMDEFVLAFASDRSGVTVTNSAIDGDGDGIYDPAIDRAPATGTALTLEPGASKRVFVLVDVARIAGDTRITATVTARTGSGAPGTTFAGSGDDGGDAVVGVTGAMATASSLLTGPDTPAPTLTKSQDVFAPDGGTRAVRGAIVTYRLLARFPSATRAAVIDDPIPAGTDYVSGSLTLDGRPLTDARDADAGGAGAGGVHVDLGDAAAASSRTVQFSVKIQ